MNAISRRSVLATGLGAAGATVLAACSSSGGTSSAPALVDPSGSAVAAAERKRSGTGRQRNAKFTASPTALDLGGRTVQTWSFNGEVPGAALRITAGDTLAAQVVNHLPQPTAVHWHGLALRNNMDGVPPVTQRAIQPGADLTYRFVADDPGTYWFHPHVGAQLDRGLYGALIVEDPREPLAYDDEWVVVLDDWLDGVTGTPDEVLAALKKGMGSMGGGSSGSPSRGSGMQSMQSGGMDMGDMGGMDMSSASASPSASDGGMGGMDMGGMSMKFMLMGATSKLLGGDAGDVKYPFHLVNGRVPTDPAVYSGKPGRRVRLRIINAGGDTAYRVALGGHRMTITHTDGYPVVHEQVDALLLGMGERYDVLVTLKDGVFPLVALAEGKNAAAMALVRTASGAAPATTVRPKELDGRILASTALRAAEGARLSPRTADRTHRLELTGSMAKYDWAINGRPFAMDNPTASPFLVGQGQRIRLDFVNTTSMWHPMHLHGHTFQVGDAGPRKDTVIVLPKQTVSCWFDADNPGRWLTHCHNIYHGEAGMMGLVAYSG